MTDRNVMTDMSTEAMKLALEAMGLIGADLVCEAAHHERADRHGVGEPCPIQARWHHAFAALREALANEALERMAGNARELGLDYEPAQQEPVAWRVWRGDAYELFFSKYAADRRADCFTKRPDVEPLYTSSPAQRPWVGLSDEELVDVASNCGMNGLNIHGYTFARAIEAKLRSKNT